MLKAEVAFRNARKALEILVEETRPRKLKGLEASVQTARMGVETAELNLERSRTLEKQIRAQIALSKIIAPRDGILIYNRDGGFFDQETRIGPGTIVREGQPLFTLYPQADDTEPLVRTLIQPNLLNAISPHVGDSVRVRIEFDTGSDDLIGVIEKISLVPQPDRNGLIAEPRNGDRTGHYYPVLVRIKKDDRRILPGMSVSVEYYKDFYTVPLDALYLFRQTELYRKSFLKTTQIGELIDYVAVKTKDNAFVVRQIRGRTGYSESGLVFGILNGLDPDEVVSLDPNAELGPNALKGINFGDPYFQNR